MEYEYRKKTKSEKVLAAMSGGVDSSVAAALLQKRGYFVVGVFMKFWSEPPRQNFVWREGKAVCENQMQNTKYTIPDTNKCCSGDAYEAAKSVCAKLDIPFRALDVRKEFKKSVVDYFISEYAAGRTPNPCVRCNEKIKFKLLLKTAKKWGMDFVATGHYVRLRREFPISKFQFSKKFQITNSKHSIFKLLTAKDKEKDQSYFLYNLAQEQLRRVLFPIGDYTKEEVRKMAKKWGLSSAERPESFEVCFVPDKRTADFLARHIKAKPGKIVDEKGRQIGEHRGLPFYTIGQRRGLGAVKGAGPFHVAAKNPAKNELVAANNPRSPLLSRKALIAEKVNWILGKSPKLPIKIMARIRYRQPLQEARIMNYELRIKNKELKNKSKSIIHNSRFLIRFNKPQRAITSGQSVVFYDDQEVLGGGVIPP